MSALIAAMILLGTVTGPAPDSSAPARCSLTIRACSTMRTSSTP